MTNHLPVISCATEGRTNLRSESHKAFFFFDAQDHVAWTPILLPSLSLVLEFWFEAEEDFALSLKLVIGVNGTKSSKSAKFWGTSTYILSIISLQSLMTARTNGLLKRRELCEMDSGEWWEENLSMGVNRSCRRVRTQEKKGIGCNSLFYSCFPSFSLFSVALDVHFNGQDDVNVYRLGKKMKM